MFIIVLILHILFVKVYFHLPTNSVDWRFCDFCREQITYPVAKGMCLMSHTQRAAFWQTLQTKPQAAPVIASLTQARLNITQS